ncbi:MAG: hypothetical protein ACE5F1_01405 [Planctomycetota bacterium]
MTCDDHNATVTLADILAEERNADRPGAASAAAMLDDWRLVLLVLSWPQVQIEQLSEWDRVSRNPTWQGLWATVRIDEGQLGAILGLSDGEAMRVLDRAIELRMIYPDGTVSDSASEAAGSLTAVALEAASKKGVKPRRDM